jgi:methanethiol S-methyltransferase
MTRSIHLLFGIVAYAIFFLTFLYLVGFVADLPELPRTVDHPGTTMAMGWAVAIDIALILLFGVQHSVMARQGFKQAWTRIVPEPIERSVYIVCASLALIVMFAFWQPMPATVWDLAGGPAEPVFWCVFGLGWLIVLLSTFLINHFELFGLAQVWGGFRSREATAPRFRKPLFYKIVRHPLYSGFIIAFWATPRMTVGHLLLAIGMSAYILIAIEHEERDLVRMFGADYEAYRVKVGKLAPRLRRS